MSISIPEATLSPRSNTAGTSAPNGYTIAVSNQPNFSFPHALLILSFLSFSRTEINMALATVVSSEKNKQTEISNLDHHFEHRFPTGCHIFLGAWFSFLKPNSFPCAWSQMSYKDNQRA